MPLVPIARRVAALVVSGVALAPLAMTAAPPHASDTRRTARWATGLALTAARTCASYPEGHSPSIPTPTDDARDNTGRGAAARPIGAQGSNVTATALVVFARWPQGDWPESRCQTWK